VEENVDVLRLARICFEDADACVVSKIRDGRVAIFLLNYSPGKRAFRLTLPKESVQVFRIRPIYPQRLDAFEERAGETIEFNVRAESVTILDINDGLKTMPPENASAFPVDVVNWKRNNDGYTANFLLPDIRAALVASRDPNIPTELLSLDQVRRTVIGRGKLPEQFLETYGFRDDKIVQTWKFAPWAFADKVWLVYRPAKPPRLSGTPPKAQVNGKDVPLIPRVDYRPEKVESWTCPLFFADVTNIVDTAKITPCTLSGLNEKGPASCAVTAAADRY
jgi:hypothetical protein